MAGAIILALGVALLGWYGEVAHQRDQAREQELLQLRVFVNNLPRVFAVPKSCKCGRACRCCPCENVPER